MLETDAVQVVPDESHLGVDRRRRWRRSKWSAAAIRPICAAATGASFSTSTSLRIINPDVIGKDVTLPDIGHSLPGQQPRRREHAMQGRDLTYVLPPQVRPHRVDGAGRCHRHPRRDRRELRASSSRSASAPACSRSSPSPASRSASLMMLFVLVRLARRGRQRTPADERAARRRGRIVGAAIASCRRCSASANSRAGTRRCRARAGGARASPRPAPSAGRSASASPNRPPSDGAGRFLVDGAGRGKQRGAVELGDGRRSSPRAAAADPRAAAPSPTQLLEDLARR